MNRRIRVIYLLTIFGILAFCSFEGYWLHQQCVEFVQDRAADMYLEMVETADTLVARQTQRELSDFHGIYRVNNVSKDDSTTYSGYIVVLANDVDFNDERVSSVIDSIDSGMVPTVVEDLYRFAGVDVTSANNKDFQEAMNRMLVYGKVPFDPDSLISEIKKVYGISCRAKIVEKEPNRIWSSKIRLPESLLHPQVGVLYPYNPIGGRAVDIVADIPIGETLRDMALSLVVALFVAAMLITCLVLQIKTIRRQQKIADFQKGYTLSMLHELKRPIGALKLFISFMRNPRLNDADRREALDNGAKEVDNLASYFEKLRAITYSEAYDAPLSLSTFDLAEAARDCVANFRAKVELHADAECIVTAEQQSMVNVLANLIENAVKYSPTDSPVDIFISKSETIVEITVADRGRGIPDADKTKVFDRFYRVGDNSDVPGIGLGLAYVRQVITAHGGEILVSDRDGGGTVFTIKLPQ